MPPSSQHAKAINGADRCSYRVTRDGARGRIASEPEIKTITERRSQRLVLPKSCTNAGAREQIGVSEVVESRR